MSDCRYMWQNYIWMTDYTFILILVIILFFIRFIFISISNWVNLPGSVRGTVHSGLRTLLLLLLVTVTCEEIFNAAVLLIWVCFEIYIWWRGQIGGGDLRQVLVVKCVQVVSRSNDIVPSKREHIWGDRSKEWNEHVWPTTSNRKISNTILLSFMNIFPVNWSRGHAAWAASTEVITVKHALVSY